MSLSPNVMGRPLVVRDATGQDVWIEPGLGSPDGVLARPKGSIFYRLDVAQMWQNTDGAVAWSLNVTLDTPLGGDLTGTVDAATVVGLAGVLLDTAPPVNGDVLIFNNVTNRWEHTSLTFGGGPPSGPAGGSLAGVYPDPSLSAVGTAGTYGSASSVPVLTTTAEGRVSSVVSTPITFPAAPSSVVSVSQPVPTTSGPTNATTTFVVVPQMTVTLTPASVTNWIEVQFDGSFYNDNNDKVEVAIFVDGVISGTQRSYTSGGAAHAATIALHRWLQLSVASHTIDVRFRCGVSGGTAVGLSTERCLSVAEHRA